MRSLMVVERSIHDSRTALGVVRFPVLGAASLVEPIVLAGEALPDQHAKLRSDVAAALEASTLVCEEQRLPFGSLADRWCVEFGIKQRLPYVRTVEAVLGQLLVVGAHSGDLVAFAKRGPKASRWLVPGRPTMAQLKAYFANLDGRSLWDAADAHAANDRGAAVTGKVGRGKRHKSFHPRHLVNALDAVRHLKRQRSLEEAQVYHSCSFSSCSASAECSGACMKQAAERWQGGGAGRRPERGGRREAAIEGPAAEGRSAGPGRAPG